MRIHDRDLSPAEIAILAAVAPPVDGPALNIVRNGGNLEISWPADATGWVLEENTALETQAWTPAAGVVNNRLTLPAPTTGRKFYRLRQE